MQAVRENVITMIKNMPQDVSVEDIMEELFFRYEVDQGLKQLDEGKAVRMKKSKNG